MKLDFKLMKLKEESETFKRLMKLYKKISNPRHQFVNEFIVVGYEDGNYKVLQLNEEGLSLFGGLKLDFLAYSIPKEELIWDGSLYTELDINKENLTIDIIDNIKSLN